MPISLTPIRTADEVFELRVDTPAVARSIANALRSHPFVEDALSGLETVSVRFHPSKLAEAAECLSSLSVEPERSETGAEAVEIGVRYGGTDGPDFDEVCGILSCSPDELIALHTGTTHTVEMLGFIPGFAYTSGLPERVQVPRRSTPRPRLPAGSIGISGAMTGIYALPGPGGWPIIGRTEETLFDPTSEAPFRLTAGQQIKFRAL